MTFALYKDSGLDRLANRANVAQFVSFDPDLAQRFSRVHGCASNADFGEPRLAVEALLRNAPEASVNVRSYHPEHPKSREFIYGLRNSGHVLDALTRLGKLGLFTIVNETVDVHDGGVSGVVAGGALEFAPDATPRCVEEPGTAGLPRAVGIQLLRIVYGFDLDLDYPAENRVEFSIHPRRRGFRHTHTLMWEIEELPHLPTPPAIMWPNLFSRFVGDKVFGLLIAHALGFPVPRTIVTGRRVAPFQFGLETGTGEVWLRTSPVDQVPGQFTTAFGWQDPFKLLGKEDPMGEQIVSVLSQEAVEAAYSGAFASSQDQPDGVLVEGVRGKGDDFMVGRAAPEAVPHEVAAKVRATAVGLRAQLGEVRGEWVFDGMQCWILQLHRARSAVSRNEIHPGTPGKFRTFHVNLGLEALRSLVADVKSSGEGIALLGSVGVTSHFGDVLRQAEVPSYLVDAPADVGAD